MCPVLLRGQPERSRNRHIVTVAFGEYVDASTEINESVTTIVQSIDNRAVPANTEIQSLGDVSRNRVHIINVHDAVGLVIGEGLHQLSRTSLFTVDEAA